MKRTILVAGLGLIGGSLAKAIKKDSDHTVIGYDVTESTVDFAVQTAIVDEKTVDFLESAKTADIIVLAAPISASITLLEQLNEVNFEQDVVVTDVSSVKGTIFQVADQLTNSRLCFIGGHPMAGSHKAGIEAAKSHLFENAIYVLTPTKRCGIHQVNDLKNVLYHTKSHFMTLQPEEHDEMTSVVSHFPHLIASSLVHQAKKWGQVHAYLPELAAGGFRDITRIASSNPMMWQDIFQHNDEKMSRLIQDWINEMVTLKEFLDKNKKQEMIEYLDQAKEYRDGLLTSQKGALPSFYDVYVDVKDQPGAISSVVQLLAEAEISIQNIRILEIRDNVMGALRLSFNSLQDQQAAKTLLQTHLYEVSIQE